MRIGDLDFAERDAARQQIDASVADLDASSDTLLAAVDDFTLDGPSKHEVRSGEESDESEGPGKHDPPTEPSGALAHQAALRSVGSRTIESSTWNGSITRQRAAAASCARLRFHSNAR